MAQFTSSWSVPPAAWWRARGWPPLCPAREVLRAVFPCDSKPTSPQALSSLALCLVWVPCSLCLGLCAHEDFKAHLVHCAQEKAGGELPDLRPERARSDLAKVKQSHGKAEVRSLSSLMCSGCSPPGSLGVQERIGLSPATWLCRLPWASWGVAGFSSLERTGQVSPAGGF